MANNLSPEEQSLIVNVRHGLKVKGINGIEAAHALGIAPSTFYLKMAGRRRFTLPEFDSLSDLTGIDAKALLHPMKESK